MNKDDILAKKMLGFLSPERDNYILEDTNLYDMAVADGFKGTFEDWLLSLNCEMDVLPPGILTEKDKMLLDIASEVIYLNKDADAKLSGSLMLRVRGLDIRREPEDIDIIVNTLCEQGPGRPIVPEGFTVSTMDGKKSDVNAIQFTNAEGVKIDFLYSDESAFYAAIGNLIIACGDIGQLIKAKINYAANDLSAESANKHLLDVAYLFNSNPLRAVMSTKGITPALNQKYKVLSNKGSVEYKGNNPVYAAEICISLNAEYQNTDTTFNVVEITPFRLLVSLHEAEKLHSFPYEIVYDDKAAWYMTFEEYTRQLNDLDHEWRILDLLAYFDDAWFNNFKL